MRPVADTAHCRRDCTTPRPSWCIGLPAREDATRPSTVACHASLLRATCDTSLSRSRVNVPKNKYETCKNRVKCLMQPTQDRVQMPSGTTDTPHRLIHTGAEPVPSQPEARPHRKDRKPHHQRIRQHIDTARTDADTKGCCRRDERASPDTTCRPGPHPLLVDNKAGHACGRHALPGSRRRGEVSRVVPS